jgi:hypothetical protein
MPDPGVREDDRVSPAPPSAASALIPTGDPWRAGLRLPVLGTLLLALAFFLYAAPVKETPVLFDHAPWTNDPYDTAISFMMFFVPLIAVLCAPRVLLCRRAEPLPTARIHDVLRGCRVILAGITLTLAAEWVSVFVRDSSVPWNGATWLQIGMLVVMSGLDAGAALAVRRAGLPRQGGEPAMRTDPDWLGDFLRFVDTWSRRLGPAGRPALWVSGVADRHVLSRIRRHPLWTAFGVCTALGAAVGVNQGIREGYGGRVTVFVAFLLAVGMFGLLVASGEYLGLVRSSAPWHGPARRLIDAAVISSVGLLVPFALRNGLWWMVGSNRTAAGLPQLLALLGISILVIFVAAYAAETALHLHSAPRDA